MIIVNDINNRLVIIPAMNIINAIRRIFALASPNKLIKTPPTRPRNRNDTSEIITIAMMFLSRVLVLCNFGWIVPICSADDSLEAKTDIRLPDMFMNAGTIIMIPGIAVRRCSLEFNMIPAHIVISIDIIRTGMLSLIMCLNEYLISIPIIIQVLQ